MIELLYYIGEILQECWWVAVLMGLIAVAFMQFAPKQEEWDSVGDYYDCFEHNHPKEDKEGDNE